MTIRMHMTVNKRWMREQIKSHGAKNVLVEWQGTDEEALDALKADPREYFTVGECDNLEPNGSCAGHPVTA